MLFVKPNEANKIQVVFRAKAGILDLGTERYVELAF